MPPLTSIIPVINPPKEIFDIAKQKNCKTLHVYVDFKNIATGLFVRDIVEEIVLNTRNFNSAIDSSIFQAMTLMASRWIESVKNNGFDCKVFFTSDIGKSVYHTTIYDKYKYRRSITKSTYPEYAEDLSEIRNNNVLLSEKVLNRIDNIYFFNLSFLESDFLSYYLINKVYNNDPEIFNVICSNDKDHFQTLQNENTIMYYKKYGERNILDKNTIFGSYFKLDKFPAVKQIEYLNYLKNIDLGYFTTMLSIIGDSVDDVPGVNGIGPQRVVKMFQDTKVVNQILGTPEDIRKRVLENKPFFIEENITLSKLSPDWVKSIQNSDTIKTSYKMIDYECLISWLLGGDALNKQEKVDYINKVLEKDQNTSLKSCSVFYSYLSKQLEDCYLKETDVSPLFV